jgi:N-acetylneuraminate synthase
MEQEIKIGNRSVGAGKPAYIVAELSGNHNGSLDRALATVRAAAEAGADAIKLQTYTASSLTIDCSAADFMIGGNGPWSGRRLYELYEEAHTPWQWHPRLFEEARKFGLEIFSTPFDESAVRLLEELGTPAYKVASFELLDDVLLRAVAATKKPVILSTGMASIEEIAHAVSVLRSAGCRELMLLRCTSSYPAPDDTMHLATIPILASTFSCLVGISDHSMGTVAPVVGVTLGACFIEKHFTLARKDGGVDSHFSLEPVEFQEMVAAVRRTEAMIGTPVFRPSKVEEENLVFRRSLYVVEDMRAGDQFTERTVRSIRPGYGIAPQHLPTVLGRTCVRDVPRGTRLTWDLLGGGH